MAHPENVLLAMLGDQKADVRAEGVQLIQTLRSTLPRAFDTTDTNWPVCPFRPPALNATATKYTRLVDVRELVDGGADIEPPSTRAMPDTDLDNFLLEPLITSVPSHTTERAVKETIEAVAAVSGPDRQDGLSLNKRAFRNKQGG